MSEFGQVNPGWVVELEPGVWLLSADADPSRTLVLKNATRWPTERSARRAMSRVRKCCRHKFHGAEIYAVDFVAAAAAGMGVPKS